MNFEAKTYKRLGAMIGSIIGVLAMIFTVGVGNVSVGVVMLIVFTCIGFVIGKITEKRHEEK